MWPLQPPSQVGTGTWLLGAADACQYQPGVQAGVPIRLCPRGCRRRHSRLSHLGWCSGVPSSSDRTASDIQQARGVRARGRAADSRTDAGGRVRSQGQREAPWADGRTGSGSPPFLPLSAVTPSPRSQACWCPGAPPCGCLISAGSPGARRLDCRGEALRVFALGDRRLRGSPRDSADRLRRPGPVGVCCPLSTSPPRPALPGLKLSPAGPGARGQEDEQTLPWRGGGKPMRAGRCALRRPQEPCGFSSLPPACFCGEAASATPAERRPPWSWLCG